MKRKAEKEQTRVWLTTNVPNMLRHKGGTYYGRFRVSGKRKLTSLETKVYTIAVQRMRDEAIKVERLRGADLPPESGEVRMKHLVETYRARFQSLEITPASINDREISLKRLLGTWDNFEELKPSQIKNDDVWTWAARLKDQGTGFIPPLAKKAKKGSSASSVNKSITALQQILDIAVERGLVAQNVARGKPPAGFKKLRRSNHPKPVYLPPNQTMQALMDEIEAPEPDADPRVVAWQRSHRLDAGELIRFMAYSGARLKEAGKATWRDVLGDIIIVNGTKSKGSRTRPVSINPSLRALLDRIRDRRTRAAKAADQKGPALTDTILNVREAQKSIDRACAKLKVPRLTHHDFRHLFATRCLESGVDPKTIAAWMGHSDGGVLVLKLYGHVRPDHAAAAAAKVIF